MALWKLLSMPIRAVFLGPLVYAPIMAEFAVRNSLSCLVSRTWPLKDVIGASPTIAPRNSDGSMP